jgi:DNA-binding GntR family transcriptional regulator
VKTVSDFDGLSTGSTGKSAIEAVYRALHKAILEGTLAPESRLRVEELRKKFGVGSSTVREALSRLLVDKLVTAEEQRGFHVAPVSLDDLREVTSVRILLETQAVRDSIENGDDEWENRFVAAAHQLAKTETQMAERRFDESYFRDWEARNNEFHNALVAACTNGWLLRFRGTVFTHSSRYRRLSVMERTMPRDVRAEHLAIYEAAIARDVERTAEATARHIANSVDVLEARLTNLRMVS